MKIGQYIDQTPVAQTTGNSTAATAGSAPPQASSPASATRAIPAEADASANIQISKNASTLLAGGASNAEFDAEKVARISKSIEDGSFRVDPGAIADKLMSNAQELLTRAQQR